ncbi:MAG: SprT family zinc-dependent metalloprotease [Bacteroidia bacterium]
MTLEILSEKIPCLVEKNRSRNISIQFAGPDPKLIIRTPGGVLTDDARAFIEKKKTWILRNYINMKALQENRAEFYKEIADSKILYQGQYIPFVMTTAAKRSVKMTADGQIHISLPLKDQKTPLHLILFAALKALAKKYLIQRTQHLAQMTGSSVNVISVKNVKSKWGSCSGKKNINLNWYLIFLPIPLIDYVIIHELMHLREMNHSQNFWNWVNKFYPGYKAADAKIKNMSWVIGILDAPGK